MKKILSALLISSIITIPVAGQCDALDGFSNLNPKLQIAQALYDSAGKNLQDVNRNPNATADQRAQAVYTRSAASLSLQAAKSNNPTSEQRLNDQAAEKYAQAAARNPTTKSTHH